MTAAAWVGSGLCMLALAAAAAGATGWALFGHGSGSFRASDWVGVS